LRTIYLLEIKGENVTLSDADICIKIEYQIHSDLVPLSKIEIIIV